MLQEKTRSFAPAGAPRRVPPSLSRSGHEALVLRLLRAHGPMTRGQLSALSGLSRTTLYDVVGALTDDGTVVASVPEVARRGRGRPAELLALNPEAGKLLGIEFARRAVRVAAMDAAHEIIGRAEEPHGPGRRGPPASASRGAWRTR
jgi:predicted ArsR family transcriptional regulator